jgi:hypothetical protein
MAIHFPGLKNVDKPFVRVFPQIVVCLDCGTAKFTLTEAELATRKEQSRRDRVKP